VADTGKNRRSEAYISKFIKAAPTALYDIGVGPKTEWKALSKVYKKLKLFGCEPDPLIYNRLLHNGYFDKTNLFPVAISDTPTATLHVHEDGKSSSLFAIDGKSIEVRCWTLDEFDRRAGHQSRILLWMDIEGSELTALKSGPKLLESGRVKFINLEERRNGFKPAEGWCHPDELKAFIESYGFVRVATYNQYVSHHDAIYVHPSENSNKDRRR
jgi:FkbM family methyltransferase